MKTSRRSRAACLIAILLSGCSTNVTIQESDAPSVTTPKTGTLEPVALDLMGVRGGPATVAPTPVAPTSTIALAVTLPEQTTVPTTLAPALVPPTPATTVPPTKPAVVVPTEVRAPALPPPTPAPTGPPRPKATAAPTPALTPAPTRPPAVVPTVPAPPTTLATTTAAPPATVTPTATLAIANSPCRSRQLGEQRVTRAGLVIICTRTKKQLRWLVVTTTPSTTILSTKPGIAPGFDGTTIRIGLLTTTSNPIWGPIGRAITAGIDARVDSINRRGGIGGQYRVVVVKSETNYDPAETVAQIQATKAGVAAYVSLLGTPSTEAAEPLLRNESIIASPASQEARWANAPSLLPVFNSYQVQAINGIAYFAEQFALSNPTNPSVKPVVCGVSVATSFGEAGSEGIRAAATSLPITLGPIVAVGPTENSFASAVGALKGAGCQATFLTVGPAQTLGLVLTGRQLAFINRWIIMGASFSDRIVTPQTGPLFEQGAWVVGDGTQWGDETVPGMAQMKADLLASDNRFWTENPDVGLSYGWAQARTIEQLLETAVKRNDLSRAGLLAASKSMGPVDLGGIGSAIDYSQPVRLANARTTIFNVDNSYRNAIRVLVRDYGSPAAAAYRR